MAAMRLLGKKCYVRPSRVVTLLEVSTTMRTTDVQQLHV